MTTRKKIFAIDPGLSAKPGGTGWALFTEGVLFPEKAGIVQIPANLEGAEWQHRAAYIATCVGAIHMSNLSVGYTTNTDVYIELPTMFQTAKGMSCATGKDGDDSDLVKLSVLVGMIYHSCMIGANSINLVRVNEWKGTMSKDAVEFRVRQRLQVSNFIYTSHAIDAIGIGLHAMGQFAARTMVVQTPKRSSGIKIARRVIK